MKLQKLTDEKCDCGSPIGIYWVEGGREKMCSAKGCGAFYGPVEKESNDKFVMPFGKFKGMVIRDIPTEYCEWAAENMTTKNIKERFIQELNERDSEPNLKFEDETVSGRELLDIQYEVRDSFIKKLPEEFKKTAIKDTGAETLIGGLVNAIVQEIALQRFEVEKFINKYCLRK